MKVTKKMSKKKVQKRGKCKSFVKYVNYNHLMPTRYLVPTEFDAKALVTDAQMESHETKAEARKSIKAVLDETTEAAAEEPEAKTAEAVASSEAAGRDRSAAERIMLEVVLPAQGVSAEEPRELFPGRLVSRFLLGFLCCLFLGFVCLSLG